MHLKLHLLLYFIAKDKRILVYQAQLTNVCPGLSYKVWLIFVVFTQAVKDGHMEAKNKYKRPKMKKIHKKGSFHPVTKLWTAIQRSGNNQKLERKPREAIRHE